MALPPELQAYDYIYYGRLNDFKNLLKSSDIDIAQLDSAQITSSAAQFDSLANMKELLSMGVAARPDIMSEYLMPYLNYAYRFTNRDILKRLKFMLFLTTQPGAPALELNDATKHYLADPQLRPALIKVLADIHKIVPLVSPQAEPLRELLTKAGLDVPELISEVFRSVAFNRRTPLLASRKKYMIKALANWKAAHPEEGKGSNESMGGRRRTRKRRAGRCRTRQKK